MADAEAGKRFPFINLEKAMSRAQQLYDADQRGNEMSNAGAFAVWEYSEKSSGGFQTIGALRAYGIIVGEEGKIRLSKLAFDYFRDERESERIKTLHTFAIQPPLLRLLWNQWAAHPPADTLARTYLKLERGLNEQSARSVLGIYKDNLAYANLKGDAKVGAPETAKSGADNGGENKVGIGDYVRWSGTPFDQKDAPRKIVWLSDDGSYAKVFGNPTGIPVSELTVTDAPPVPSVGTVKPPPAGSDTDGGADGDLNVLLRGKRLEITADVDRAGLKRLKEILIKYEEILNIIDPPAAR